MENVERVDTVSNLFHSTLEVTISNSYGGYTGLLRSQLHVLNRKY